MADQILTQLKQHPDAWTRVDTILEYSNNQQTKVLWATTSAVFRKVVFLGHALNFFLQYFALQILEVVIKTRWKVLPPEQCEG